MEKIITFYPAYDKRSTDPKKNYGVHGVDLRMVLKGELGAVQFMLYTNWHLPHIEGRIDKPLPADLGYHSFKPMYEGQEAIRKECEFLGGKPCYYDGSTLNAERIYNVLLESGSDGVWKELESFYVETFDELR